MIKYDFDTLADRSIDHARKWDASIVQQKFPHVRKDFIPLWIADMDFQAAPEIRAALAKMATNGAYGYTYSTERWYNSVINWQKVRHHNLIQKDWLTLGYGTVPNMHILVQALVKPNESILINTPVYGPFAYAAKHNDRKVMTVPLIKNGNRYELDWTKLETVMATQHPRLLFFCNPHNPSGRVWERSELIKIAELCQKYQIILVSDEVHSEHIFKGPFTSALQLPTKYLDNLIMLTSPNKAFNLGGLKLSYSIIPNPKLRAIFRQQYTRNSVTSPNVPGQIAMTIAYEECSDWLDQCCDYIEGNLQITAKAIQQDFPGWELMDMDSSYLPWVDVAKSGIDMHTIARKMAEDAGVVVGVGDDYVTNANHFLRLNLGTSKDLIKESMTRMAKTWQKIVK